MPQRFYNYIIIIILTFFCGIRISAEAADKKFTVVIDAGHGGKDIGASDNGVMEKNINLQVAKQLESLIKKKLKNTEVVMTRTNDTYLTLQERADKANRAHGDIFISIHTNSVDKKNRNRKSIEGSSVYTLGLHKDENNLEVAMRENSVIELEKDYEQKYSGFDPQKDESYIIFEMAQKKNLSQSIKFAENIEKELVNSGRKNRGVHQAGFWVLWATSMPSVLVELDFICNPESAKYISSEKGAKELAEAIFKAVKKYEENWNKSVKSQGNDYYSTSDTGDESDVYIAEVDESSATVNVATAKPRVHKTSQNKPQNKAQNNKSGKRTRRSSRSKELSSNKSFETDGINLPAQKEYATATAVTTGNAELAYEGTQLKESSKSNDKKSGKKKKVKEEKKPKADKKQKDTASKERKKGAHNARVDKLVTVYKIQVLASADLLNQNNSRFCGLSPISTYKENNLYKYYYGECTDREEAEAMLADVKKKIPDAFIVTSKKSIK